MKCAAIALCLAFITPAPSASQPALHPREMRFTGPSAVAALCTCLARTAAERRGARPPRSRRRSGRRRHEWAGGPDRAHLDGIGSYGRAHRLRRPLRDQRLHAPPRHDDPRARTARRQTAAAQSRAHQRPRHLRAAHAVEHQRRAPGRWRHCGCDDSTA